MHCSVLFSFVFFSFLFFIITNNNVNGAKSKDVGQSSTANSKSINFTDIEEKCSKSYKIDPEYLVSLSETGSFPDEIDITPKCYIKCLLETLDVIDEKGNINANNALQQLDLLRGNQDTNTTQIIIKYCIEDRDETCKCEKSYGFVRCVMENIVEMYD